MKATSRHCQLFTLCEVCGKRAVISVNLFPDLTQGPDQFGSVCQNRACSFFGIKIIMKPKVKENEVICKLDAVGNRIQILIRNNQDNHQSLSKSLEPNPVRLNNSYAPPQTSRFGECHVCQKKFFSAAFLMKHKLYFHGYLQHVKIVFQCPFCQLVSMNLSESVLHLSYHLNRSDVKSAAKMCSLCAFVCPSEVLQIHTATMHGIQYACALCGHITRNSQTMEVHVTTHQLNAQFPSKFCNKMFDNVVDCESHEIFHASQQQFYCHRCCKSFETRVKLDLHLEEHCSAPKISSCCARCGLKTVDTKLFSKHLLTSPLCTANAPFANNVSMPEYKCAVCCKMFKTFPEVEAHRLILHPSQAQSSKELPIMIDENAIKTANSEKKPVKILTCPLCPMIFYKLQEFLGHYTSHMQPCCKFCKHTFKNRLKSIPCKKHRNMLRVKSISDDHVFFDCILKIEPSQEIFSAHFCSTCNYMVLGDKAISMKTTKKLPVLKQQDNTGKLILSKSFAINCSLCAFSTTDPFAFMSHVNCHKGDFFCPICMCPILYKSDFEKHYWDQHYKNSTKAVFSGIEIKQEFENPDLITCKFCLSQIQVGGMLHMAHMQDHLYIKCKQCNFVTQSELKFFLHRKSRHPVICATQRSFTYWNLIWMEHPKHNHFANYFKCDFCPRIFGTIDAMKKHLYMLHCFTCHICKINCSTKQNLKSHQSNVHDYKICVICNFQSWSDTEMNAHFDIHKIHCNHCAYYTHEEQKLLVHLIKKHKSKPNYMCTICTFKCTLKPDFLTHKRRAQHRLRLRKKGYQILRCSKCSFRCVDKQQLDYHLKKIHTKCNSCRRKFSVKSMKNLHQNLKHEGSHTCRLCNSTFPSKANLSIHLKSKKHLRKAFSKILLLNKRNFQRVKSRSQEEVGVLANNANFVSTVKVKIEEMEF